MTSVFSTDSCLRAKAQAPKQKTKKQRKGTSLKFFKNYASKDTAKKIKVSLQNVRKYFEVIYLVRTQCPECIKKPLTIQQQKDNSIEKWAKELNRYLLKKKEMQTDNKHMKIHSK